MTQDHDVVPDAGRRHPPGQPGWRKKLRRVSSRLAPLGLAAAIGLSLSQSGEIPAHAQAALPRAWVSGVGDDANTCARAFPCKTFGSGTQSKTEPGGEINILDGGGFGATTINKSISIVAEGFQAGVLAAGTTGIIVNAGANDVVVLRGLEIEGAGTGIVGIRFNSGAALYVEDTTINGFTSDGIRVQTGASAELHLSNVLVRNTGGSGVLLSTTSGQIDATLDGVTLDRNAVGLNVRDRSRATIRNSLVTNNTQVGLQAQAAAGAAELNVENTATSSNGIGVQAGGAGQPSTARISNVTVNGNLTGIGVGTSGAVLNRCQGETHMRCTYDHVDPSVALV